MICDFSPFGRRSQGAPSELCQIIGLCINIVGGDLTLWSPYHYHYIFIRTLFSVEFSPQSDVQREKEEAAYIFFLDFVEQLEGMLPNLKGLLYV